MTVTCIDYKKHNRPNVTPVTILFCDSQPWVCTVRVTMRCGCMRMVNSLAIWTTGVSPSSDKSTAMCLSLVSILPLA